MQRLFKNLSANSLGVIISLVGQVFALPLFLHLWSKPLYGEWLVLTTVPNLLPALEGGLGGIASSRMTLASARQDWEEVNSIFHTTLLGQICISALILLATLIGVYLGNVKAFFGFSQLSSGDTQLIFVLMVCYTLGGLWLSLYRAPYRCSELEARGSMVVNFWRISDFLVTVTVLLLHGSPVFLAECLLASVLVWTVIGFRDVTRNCPRVLFAFTGVSWKRFREMVIDGLPMLASQAATAFYMQGYPLAANRVLGSSAVVTLTTVRVLCRPALLVVQTMAWSCSPLLSRSYGAGDWKRYYRLLRIMIATSLWAGIVGLVVLTILGPWLLNAWTSGKVRSDHLTLFLFSLSISLQGVWACISSMLGSSRRHHEFNYIYGAGTLLAVCTAPWLMAFAGFKAVPVIMVMADLTFVVVGLFLCRKKLTNFRLGEIAPILTFSFYKTEAAAVWNRFKAPASSSQKKDVSSKDKPDDFPCVRST